VLELTRDAFVELQSEDRLLAGRIQAAVSRTLGQRLRAANALIFELDF
jgi:hypothetical protein